MLHALPYALFVLAMVFCVIGVWVLIGPRTNHRKVLPESLAWFTIASLFGIAGSSFMN